MDSGKIGRFLGQVLALVAICCLVISGCSLLIATTIKFLQWIF